VRARKISWQGADRCRKKSPNHVCWLSYLTYATEDCSPPRMRPPSFSTSSCATWGALTDERERRALVVLAENVPGVQAVHDHMVWVEPTPGFEIESMEDEELERKAAIQTPALRSEAV
jgi:hypothetical protein